MAERTTLTFEAVIAGMKSKLGSVGYGGTMPKGGELELTLKVAQPEPPQAPQPPGIPYSYANGRNWKPRPADIKRKGDETDEEYAARPAVAQRIHEQRDYDQSRARYDAQLEDYEEARRRFEPQQIAHIERVRAFAGISGLAATLGGIRLIVSMTPSDAGMLPGFSVGLLSVGEES